MKHANDVEAAQTPTVLTPLPYHQDPLTLPQGIPRDMVILKRVLFFAMMDLFTHIFLLVHIGVLGCVYIFVGTFLAAKAIVICVWYAILTKSLIKKMLKRKMYQHCNWVQGETQDILDGPPP